MEITRLAEIKIKSLGTITPYASKKTAAAIKAWSADVAALAVDVAEHLAALEAAAAGEMPHSTESAESLRGRLRSTPANLAQRAVELQTQKVELAALIRADVRAYQADFLARYSKHRAEIEAHLLQIGVKPGNRAAEEIIRELCAELIFGFNYTAPCVTENLPAYLANDLAIVKGLLGEALVN